MATSSLGQLTLDLVANTAGFERGMNQAERAAASAAKAMAKQEAAADRLVGAIDPIAGALQKVIKQQTELDKHYAAGIIPEGEYKRLNTVLETQAEYFSDSAVAARKSAQATAEQEATAASAAKALAKQQSAATALVGALDPMAGALQKVNAQQAELEKHYKAGLIPQADYERLNTVLNTQAAALQSTDKEFKKGAISAKQYSAALRNVPAQFTDIAVSLQAGQAPLTVLLQQGGQLKDMFGGVGNAAKALGGYVVGLVNPFTVLAAGAIAITAAFVSAEREASAFNKALFSGSASSGQTSGSLAEIAKSAAALTGNLGAAREAVIALAAVPGLSDTQFRNLAAAAASIGEFTGKSAADVAKSFGELGDNATKAAQKVSAQYGLITSAQYDAIKALDDQGKAQQANDLLSETLNANAQKRLVDYRASLSDVERDWNDIGAAISNAYSRVKGELFPDSAKQIEIIERILKTRADGGLAGALSSGLSKLNSGLGLGTGDNDDSTEALEHQLTILKTGQAVQEARAAAAGEETRANQQRIEAQVKFDALTKANLSDQAKLAKDITEARRLGLAAGKSQAEVDKTVAEIQAKYDKAQPKTPKYKDDAGQKMLETLRQQSAVLQTQSDSVDSQTGKYKTLGEQAQALVKFNQEIADIKNKDVLTADQKSLLASEDLIRAQLKRNVAIEAEVAARKASYESAQKLQALQDAQDSKVDTAQQGYDDQLAGTGQGSQVRERLKAELAIRKDYANQFAALAKQNVSGDLVGQDYEKAKDIVQEGLAKQLVAQQDYYNQVDELSKNFFNGTSEAWANYATEAQDYSAQAAEATTTVLNDSTSAIASGLDGIVKGTETVGEAFANLGVSMASAILGALEQIAAKWIVTEALQLAGITTVTTATVAGEAAKTAAVVGAESTKTAAKVAADATTTASSLAGIATTLAANLAAAAETLASWLPAALVASVGSFGAAAIVGGAALVAAFALTKGFEAGGYTGDGGSSEPAGIVHKGEYVFTKQQTSRIGRSRLAAIASNGYETGGFVTDTSLGSTTTSSIPTSARVAQSMNDIKSPSNMGSTTVNLIEDSSRAGQTQERTGDQGEKMIDAFVSDLLGDGRTKDAMSRKFGLQSVGT